MRLAFLIQSRLSRTARSTKGPHPPLARYIAGTDSLAFISDFHDVIYFVLGSSPRLFFVANRNASIVQGLPTGSAAATSLAMGRASTSLNTRRHPVVMIVGYDTVDSKEVHR